MSFRNWLWNKVVSWLVVEHPPVGMPLFDFEHMRGEIRPGDVLLVEGCSRVSRIIKGVTQSAWTHSALYIGRLHDIEDPRLRERLKRFHDGDPAEQLVVEGLMDQGTIISPLSKYQILHTRICRPRGLSHHDAQRVIGYAIEQLGAGYNVRQLIDLARFLFPYDVVPRRWRSSLFEHNAGDPTRNVCSSMLAAAFAAVHFPILPVVHRQDDGSLRLYKRNFKLYTPRDFDYSPYFDIIKYPLLDCDDVTFYRRLPWDEQGVICNDESDCHLPSPITTPETAPAAAAGTGGVPALGKSRFSLFRRLS
jgi:hypothetical protein